MRKVPKFIFDSYSLFVYLEGEEGAQKVSEIIKHALVDTAEIFMSVINWGEVYYLVLRERSEKATRNRKIWYSFSSF